MNKKLRDILEINKILEKVENYIVTPKGKSIFSTIDEYRNKNDLLFEIDVFKDTNNFINTYGLMPIFSDIDLKKAFEELKKTRVLDEITLDYIREDLNTASSLHKIWSRKRDNYEKLDVYFKQFSSLDVCLDEINKVISAEKTIKDTASEKLFTLRKNIVQEHKNLRAKLQDLLRKYKDKLTDSNFYMRNGRYVLPFQTTYKNSINGVIQDISESGLTTFIEPIEVLTLENNINYLELLEKEEVTKILYELTEFLLKYKQNLITNNEIIAKLDILQAKVKYLKEIDGSIPNISKQLEIKLYNAWHPLLDKNSVVKNNFLMTKDKPILLISGPNAGGKTIALKTVATLVALAKMAIPLNCDADSSVGFFNKIYVDIGDSQSIENNLSTFSGHISNISGFFKYISSNDLVVLDEVGNGTDPKEGEVLSVAITRYLLKKRCFAAISSHYQLLKKFGLSNEAINNASFVFDELTITPKYKMLLGVSGKSYGLQIAKKYGIAKEIIDDAKHIYDEEYNNEEIKLTNYLEDLKRELIDKESKIKSLESKLKAKEDELNSKEKELKKTESQLRQNKISDLDDLIDNKISEIEDIYSDFVKNKNLKEAREKIAALKNKNAEEYQETFNIGDYILVKSLDIKGKIVSISGKKARILTEDSFNMTSELSNLTKINAPQGKKTFGKGNIDTQILGKKNTPLSLNLIGMHIDEGLTMLDNYLSDAIAANYKSVKIIHGFGTGKLRQAIWEHLKHKSYVKSLELGVDGGNGAGGSTIVTLK